MNKKSKGIMGIVLVGFMIAGVLCAKTINKPEVNQFVRGGGASQGGLSL